MSVSPEDVEELARRIWEAFRGRRITLDRRGRPNYFLVRSLARRLLEASVRAGVKDPLHEIDWESVLDPELEPNENIRLFITWVEEHLGRKVEASDEVERYITELERYIDNLKRELDRAPEELKPNILEEIRRAEEELRRIRARPEERRRTPPKRRVKAPPPPPSPPKPPPPPPAPPPKPPPVEEVRYRIEMFIRGRVERVYRFDWTDLRCRISYHRDVEDVLRKAVEEIDGRVERVVEARPPLRVMYVDFSKAKIPPAMLSPELERIILWSKFSAIIASAGGDPSEYTEDFEATLEMLRDRPFEEKQRRIEMLARDIARGIALPPPPVIPIEEIRRVVREEIRRLESAVTWRPKSAEEVKMLAEATLLATSNRAVLRRDAQGHLYWGPSDGALALMSSFLDRWAIEYFRNCPVCRFTLPGGALSPTEFVEHLIEKERIVPELYIEWLRRLARDIEERERRGL
jgi:hypothetical protein